MKLRDKVWGMQNDIIRKEHRIRKLEKKCDENASFILFIKTLGLCSIFVFIVTVLEMIVSSEYLIYYSDLQKVGLIFITIGIFTIILTRYIADFRAWYSND